MKYFYLSIFVIPWACLIRKYWSKPGHFFLYFSAFRGTVNNEPFRSERYSVQRKSITKHKGWLIWDPINILLLKHQTHGLNFRLKPTLPQ